MSDSSALVRTSQYLLVVSSSGWRKRRELAIDVWRRLSLEVAGIRLVLVGPELTAGELRVARLRESELGLVQVRQDVSEAQLFSLYKGAVALLQVSKYEGFGWPIVEANSVGTPAICVDEPIFREIAEGAHFISESFDSDEMASIARILLAPKVSTAPLENARRFSWEGFVAQIQTLAMWVTSGASGD